MADNVAITEGSGTTIATEDVSGVQHQKVKVEFGADGVATLVSSTDPLPVDLGSNNDVTLATLPDTAAGDLAAINSAVSGTVTVDGSGVTQPVSGTVTANLSSADNTVLDNIDTNTAAAKTALETAGGLLVNLGANNDVTVTGSVTADLGANNDVTMATLPDTASGDLAAINAALSGTLTVTGGGGGTEYTEDAAAASDPVGNALMLVREDARAGSLTSADGDNVALRGNNKGEAYVKATDTDALLTTIDSDTSTLAGAVSGTEMQVDVVSSALPTGAATAANQQTDALTDTELRATPVPISGSVTADLGVNNDVTVTGTVDLGATDNAVLDSIAAKDFSTETTLAAINAKMVTGTDIGDVTINNSTGAAAVNIQDGGNTITVDGTVAATQSGSWSLAANQSVNVAQMNGVATTMGNGASGTGVQRVTIASDSTGQIISRGDIAHDAADSGNPLKVGGKAQSHLADPAEVSAANDRVNALFDRVGRQAVYQGYVLKSAVINTSTSGDNTIVAAVATKRIRVLAVAIVSDGTTDVRWESGASGTALTGQIPLQAREGYTISNPWGLFETAAVNTLLNLELTAAVNVHGWVTYIEVDD